MHWAFLKHVSEKHVIKQYVIQYKTTFIRNSDAHYLKQIGEIYTVFKMSEISFSEIRMALNQQDNRYCKLHENHFGTCVGYSSKFGKGKGNID
jgi:PHP family Zn ribbon phosphoesterase